MHPLNRDWLRRQRGLDRGAWLEGMSTEGALEGGATVRLHVELDPLEALRLGTYVGSCLGIGGMLAHSAAAVVLDLNKHVVYARTAEGTVLGRQLLAVSEDERLVAFQPYPERLPAGLKGLFAAFDEAYARRLGVPLHRRSEDVGRIENLLSQDWWDDGAWDFS